MEEPVKEKQQVYGHNTVVANGPHHQYHLDLMLIEHFEDQSYDTARVCIDALAKQASLSWTFLKKLE
jgi:hypothetical protein